MHDAVTVTIDAPIAAVWDLVSDVTRIGEFSPETFEAEWLGDATGPELGARFRGHVKRNGRGPIYWVPCEVTHCVPERDFGFTVLGPGDRRINNWRYQLEPLGDGVAVTESFSLEPTPFTRVYWALAGRWRGRTNRDGMRQTLERIKAVAEG